MHQRLSIDINNWQNKLSKNQTCKKKITSQNLIKTLTELLAIIDGMVLLGEVTPRTMDYLISFGERLSIKLVSSAINDLGIKSIPLNW